LRVEARTVADELQDLVNLAQVEAERVLAAATDLAGDPGESNGRAAAEANGRAQRPVAGS
jgi:hypothetical protein